jgi:hypothetical protein
LARCGDRRAATTLLFEGGKYLIALYVSQSNVASSMARPAR